MHTETKNASLFNKSISKLETAIKALAFNFEQTKNTSLLRAQPSRHKVLSSLIGVFFLMLSFALPQTGLAATGITTQFVVFSDVPPSHQYKKAIDYLEEKGLAKGYEDGTFKPDEKLNRAEFLTFILNATGNADEYEAKEQASFPDVPKDAWFYGAVETALQMGLIEKKEEGQGFVPTLGVPKTQALEQLFQLYDIKLSEPAPTENLFKDVQSGNKHANLAKTAKLYGIFEAQDSNYFRPFKVLNRGELAYYIYKIETYGKSGFLQKETKSLSNKDESTIYNNKEFSVFLDVWKHVHEEFLYREKIKDSELIQGAIKGLINQLDDPYSTYEPAAGAKQFSDDLNGELEGVGIEINRIEKDVIIVSVVKDSPAQRAGLEAKDILKKVDDIAINAKSMTEIANLIRGKAGSRVKITIQRSGKTLEFEATRAKINIPEVSYEVLQDSIGLITISTFSGSAASEFAIAAHKLREEHKVKGYIIDLRNNPGGFLNAAVDTLKQIIPQNKIITIIYSGNGDSLTQYSSGPGSLSDYPIAVLINKGSASAAEIMAAAIKEHKVGTLIGENSFGKGTVQDLSYYSDGSFLKLTIAKWLTPSGAGIDKVGVKPDIYVNNPVRTKDAQLEKALEVIKAKIK